MKFKLIELDYSGINIGFVNKKREVVLQSLLFSAISMVHHKSVIINKTRLLLESYKIELRNIEDILNSRILR